MKSIERTQLKLLIDSEADFVLVNALRPPDFAKVHIPNSINLPIRLAEFDEMAARLIPEKDTKIVVYCTGPG